MSFEGTSRADRAVICDCCGDYSWVGDYQWRPMPQGTPERPLHLCPRCRHQATWCESHRQYHLPETQHRQACADCGGLFTSVVRERATRCQACRRAAGELLPPPPHPPERPRSLAQFLAALGAPHRR